MTAPAASENRRRPAPPTASRTFLARCRPTARATVKHRVRAHLDANGVLRRWKYDGNFVKRYETFRGVTGVPQVDADQLPYDLVRLEEYEYEGDHIAEVNVSDESGTSTWTYTWTGNTQVDVTDPTNVVTTLTLDPAGQAVGLVDAAAPPRNWAWHRNGQGQVEDVITPTGGDAAPVVHYGYDGHGNVTSIEFADGRSVTVDYGAAEESYAKRGLPKGVWSAGAIDRTDFRYDGAGRLRDVFAPNGSTTHVDYADDYGAGCPSCSDAGGERISTVRNADGTGLDVVYDGRGRVQARALVDTSGSAFLKTRYHYDGAGALVRMDQCGRQNPTTAAECTYDESGELQRLSGETTVARNVLTVTPDLENGPEVGETKDEVRDGAGFEWVLERDALGRPKALTAPDGGRHDYGYDRLSNLDGIVDPNGVNVAKPRDDAGRLASQSDGTSGTWGFGYDYDGPDPAHAVGELVHYDPPAHPSGASIGYDTDGASRPSTGAVGRSTTLTMTRSGAWTARGTSRERS